jgi:hypothetical protein
MNDGLGRLNDHAVGLVLQGEVVASGKNPPAGVNLMIFFGRNLREKNQCQK